LAGEKDSFFDAAISIFSPLAGLRPSRSGEALTLNFPNPAKETSSSLAAALMMLSTRYPESLALALLICRELLRR
jgi:hypothetical protein